MSLIMQPARIPGGGVFPVAGVTYPSSGQTFLRGAILVPQDGNTGLYVEAGVNPAVIAGLALQAVDTAPGFAMANNPATITGRETKVSMAQNVSQTIFEGTLTDGSSTRVTPAVTDIGQRYGVTAYSGVWTVDQAKVGNSARVEIVDIDTTTGKNLVFFRFLPSTQPGS